MTRASSSDLPLLRLVAHPLRLRILSVLTGRVFSAAEIARELGDTQANVSYHLRRLADGSLVRLVEEEKVRGGTAKRYTHDADAAEAVNNSSAVGFQQLAAALAQQLIARSSRYRSGSSYAFTDAEVLLSAEDRHRLEEQLRQWGRHLSEASERAITRGPEAAHPLVTVAVSAMLFEIGKAEE